MGGGEEKEKVRSGGEKRGERERERHPKEKSIGVGIY